MRLQGLKLDSKLAQEVLELLAARAQPKLRCASSAARIARLEAYRNVHSQVLQVDAKPASSSKKHPQRAALTSTPSPRPEATNKEQMAQLYDAGPRAALDLGDVPDDASDATVGQ